MRKLLVYIFVFIFTLVSTSCTYRMKETNEEKLGNDDYSKELNNAETDCDINMNETETANLIVNKINDMQKDSNIIALSFYGDNMYAVLEHMKKTELISINIDKWEEKKIELDVENIDKITLHPSRNGLILKEWLYANVSNNYIFNENLNNVIKYTGMLVDYSKKRNEIFYYDRYENAIIRESLENGKKYIERELVEEDNIRSGDLVSITKATMSFDGRYIYYIGEYWMENKSENCWGFFDLLDLSNDTMYRENRSLKSSENVIIIMDSRSGKSIIEQTNDMENKYLRCNNENETQEMYLQSVKEVDTGIISNEGNIMITAFSEDLNLEYENINIYDTNTGEVIMSFDEDDRIWMKNGIICEKHRLIIGLEAEHMSEDEFSPTGKYHVYCVKY